MDLLFEQNWVEKPNNKAISMNAHPRIFYRLLLAIANTLSSNDEDIIAIARLSAHLLLFRLGLLILKENNTV